MITTLVILLAGYAGFVIGSNLRELKDKFEELYHTDEDDGEVINPHPPEIADVNQSSSVITPKTPSEIEREAELALRRKNGL
jgi:hypothetical protein